MGGRQSGKRTALALVALGAVGVLGSSLLIAAQYLRIYAMRGAAD